MTNDVEYFNKAANSSNFFHRLINHLPEVFFLPLQKDFVTIVIW